MKTPEEIIESNLNITPSDKWGYYDRVIKAMQEYSNSQNKELIEALDEAREQLEYLDGKFTRTGSTASVLSRITTLLNQTKEV